MLKVRRTRESDIFFIQLDEGKVAKTVQRDPDIFIDLDKKNQPLSLEIVNVKETPLEQVRHVIREFNLKPQLEGFLRLAEAVRFRSTKTKALTPLKKASSGR